MNTSGKLTVENFALGTFCRAVLPAAAIALVTGALYLIFCVVPPEAQMGEVQRIFYFHVGSAITSYVLIGILLIASSFFLVTREEPWDAMAQGAAGVAFLFCSLVLLTGMIWGHSAWNTWWRWEPRLVSSLVLWLILAGYLTVRNFSGGHARQQNFLAVLGIIAACFIPIVIFSVRLMNQAEQLHPQVIGRQGLTDPSYRLTLAVSTVALITVALWLLVSSFVSRLLERETERAERAVNNLQWETKHERAA